MAMPIKTPPSKEVLRQDFKTLPMRDMGIKYSVSITTVRKWMKQYGLKTRKDTKYPKEYFYNEYVVKKREALDIANELHVSRDCIYQYLRKYHIPTRANRSRSLLIYKYSKIKYSAKKRGLDFTVSQEYLFNLYIKQNKQCALTGLDITLPISGDNTHTASLDRINSSKGYVPDNVQWVHKTINVMKWTSSTEEFIKFCKLVCLHNKP